VAVASLPAPSVPPTREAFDAPTFAELGLPADFVKVLEQAGIVEPFPIQCLTIPDALAGRDVCGKARTGSGKTFAFGLPLLDRATKSAPRKPGAIVLAPTRELANQITEALKPFAAVRGLRLAPIYGGVSMLHQIEALQRGVDVVIGTPGRVNDLLARRELNLDHVTTVVIDEADQMADLGFLPQVRRILDRIPGEPQTMLFSATLDGEVDQLVRRYQHDPVFYEAPEADDGEEPDMLHRFIGVTGGEKAAVAADIAAGPERTLLFTRTQRGAERLQRLLEREGIRAGLLHGGLGQPSRERALRNFASGSQPVLVATNVAARGIHVDGVDIVVHYDAPEDAKTYLHRSGRTARAGATGVVVTLVEPSQLWSIDSLRKAAGVREVVVSMRPGDPRLADLAGWTPPLEAEREPQPEEKTFARAPKRGWNFGGARRRRGARS
jgi:superfamily II DNA/RNA helicase